MPNSIFIEVEEVRNAVWQEFPTLRQIAANVVRVVSFRIILEQAVVDPRDIFLLVSKLMGVEYQVGKSVVLHRHDAAVNPPVSRFRRRCGSRWSGRWHYTFP